MREKVYKKLLNHAIDSYTYFQIKYLFSTSYNITYYPTIKGMKIFNSKLNIYSRYYKNVNKTAISNFKAHLINLLLLSKVYYESNN